MEIFQPQCFRPNKMRDLLLLLPKILNRLNIYIFFTAFPPSEEAQQISGQIKWQEEREIFSFSPYFISKRKEKSLVVFVSV